jgi:hypothetical protein
VLDLESYILFKANVATHLNTKLVDEEKTENENKSEITKNRKPFGKNQKRETENRHGVIKQFHGNKFNPPWIKEESKTTSISR